jgi:hypothetical protein
MLTSKAVHLTLVVLALLIVRAAPQTQSPVVHRYPEVLNVELGIGNVYIAAVGREYGSARFRVSTDGAGVSVVSPLEPASKVPSLVTLGRQFILRWRFVPHRPTTFETTITVARRRDPTCDDLEANHWGTFNLPLEATFLVSPILSCNRSVSISRDATPVGRIAGVVYCDCEENRILSDVGLSLYRVNDMEVQWDSQRSRTGTDGRFDFGDLPPGDYLLSATADGYLSRDYRVRVDPSQARAIGIDPRLPPNPKYVPEAPVRVGRAPVPGYPAEARRQGTVGQVILRVEQSGERSAVSGPAELRQAAVENLRSWEFSPPRTAFEVVYNYSLVAGDCGPQQNPTVRMELPYRVEIVAKRPITCGQPVTSAPATRR